MWDISPLRPVYRFRHLAQLYRDAFSLYKGEQKRRVTRYVAEDLRRNVYIAFSVSLYLIAGSVKWEA